ncbi:MAG: SDR family oxidoreductase [Armatimonadetes bacterium]|nr:SDR family oxidoreductase [Armatimonadota bacterium]
MTEALSHPPETVLITGASGGIGAALAERFAQAGCRLVLVARSRDRLAEVARDLAGKHGVEIETIPLDLARPGAARELFERADCPVDILVNNAGYGLHGRFAELGLDEQSGMMHLNMVSTTELVHFFLPGMLERRRGKILNVASTAAFQPGPLMAVYYASKAYVLSFSEALAEELGGTGVTVTALCPGPTRSGFQARAQVEGSLFLKLPMMDVASVAEAGYRALLEGKTVIVPGFLNRLLALSVRFSPRSLVVRASHWMARKPQP